MGTDMAITAYRTPLDPVTSFKYLGRLLLVVYNDCTLVVHNLWRAQHKWERMSRVFSREGEYHRTPGGIYVAVVQAVLLYR